MSDEELARTIARMFGVQHFSWYEMISTAQELKLGPLQWAKAK